MPPGGSRKTYTPWGLPRRAGFVGGGVRDSVWVDEKTKENGMNVSIKKDKHPYPEKVGCLSLLMKTNPDLGMA